MCKIIIIFQMNSIMSDIWFFYNNFWKIGKLLSKGKDKDKDKDKDTNICSIEFNKQIIEIDDNFIKPVAYEEPTSVEDLIKLSHLHEPSVLHVLEERYKSSKIYTDTGPVLIAINPFKNLDIYNTDMLNEYKIDKQPNISHVYKVGYNALKSLLEFERNQTILASGESGSGKTVTTKHLLHYLTYMSNSGSDLEDIIIYSNPLMEAFGNAKTIKNENSSRFGKFIQLFINDDSKIKYASIKTYLLEKIRVIQQNNNERNFHIFYQLLQSNLKQKYLLKNIDDYKILNNGYIELEYESDHNNFIDILKAFDIMNFDQSEVDDIFNLLSIILNLGNLNFTSNNDISCLHKNEYLDTVLLLSGWKYADINTFMCHEYIKIGNEIIKKNLTIQTSEVKLHTFMQDIYESLFNFIIDKINVNLKIEENDTYNFIGILDIFGFEIFDNNNLEQLHINYTNEYLQQIFNKNIFKTEQDEYIKEDINYKLIDFIDNIDRLHSVHKIFKYVDEECFVPKGNDISLLNKLSKLEIDYFNVTNLGKAKKRFNFDHYAGNVTYNIRDFVHKNKYHVNKDTINFTNKSSIKLIHNLNPKKTKKTISSTFKYQLSSLVKIIEKTQNYFVRCIKPNDLNKPDMLDIEKVLVQLRYGGITEAVKVVQAGFPVKLSHEHFTDRYHPLTFNSMNFTEFKDLYIEDVNTMQIGKSKIFLKQHIYEHLEDIKRKKLTKSTIIIQKNIKCYLLHNRYKKILSLCLSIQSLYKGLCARRLYTQLKKTKACTKIQSIVRMYLIITIHKKKIKSIQLIFRVYRTYKTNKRNKILNNTKQLIACLTINYWYKNIKAIHNDKLKHAMHKIKQLEDRQNQLLEFKEKYEALEKRMDKDISAEDDFQAAMKVNGSLILRMQQLLDDNERFKRENEIIKNNLNKKKSLWDRIFKN
jgi:myosin heavy subunit